MSTLPVISSRTSDDSEDQHAQDPNETRTHRTIRVVTRSISSLNPWSWTSERFFKIEPTGGAPPTHHLTR